MILEEKGKKILDAIVKIKKKREEQEKLYAKLEFQALLMLQGIDPQQIKRIGFDLSKVKLSERLKYWKDGNLSKEYVNVLVMKDAKEIILERPIKL